MIRHTANGPRAHQKKGGENLRPLTLVAILPYGVMAPVPLKVYVVSPLLLAAVSVRPVWVAVVTVTVTFVEAAYP